MKNGIELVMHPGHGKCGSTSIQVDVYKRREQLEERGVYLPDANFRCSFEPNILPEQSYPGQFYPIWYLEDLLWGRLPVSHLERRLDESLGHAAGHGCERLLISAENLSNIECAYTLDVHRVIASRFDRSRIFYYIRRQDDWILSSWQQWHHKVGTSLRAWVDQCLEKHIPGFLATADQLEDVYGEGSLSIIPLHHSAFAGGDLLSDFYRRAGLDLTDESREPISNQAVNPYLCEILARIPSVFEAKYHDTQIADLLERHVSSSELLYRRHRDFMDEAMRIRILKHFERENRELHRRYFEDLDFDDIYGPPPAAREEQRTAQEFDAVKEVLAIQMELVLHLLKSKEAHAKLLPSLVGSR